jgi:hypothetical protein
MRDLAPVPRRCARLATGLVLSRPPLVLDALELPDGVARDVKSETGTGPILGFGNLEFNFARSDRFTA